MKKLEKEIYDESNGLWYTLGEDDIYYPNLIMPKAKAYFIGKYGRLHEKFLREHKPIVYTKLLTLGKMNEYLHEIDVQATEKIDAIVKTMAKAENCNEQLKATDQMKWVGLMNNYKACAEEIVLSRLVYR